MDQQAKDASGAGIAIGGSAGALGAMTQLLASLPAGFAGAGFVVLHVPPQGPSRLAAVLAGAASVPVREAEDKEPIAPGTVYVAPPNYHLLVERAGTLSLSIDEPVHFSRPSIDVLFESVALAYGARAVGIVLSGASSDGAAGLAAIGSAGGETWVLDPMEASAPALPEAAIHIAHPSRVMSAFALAGALRDLCAQR